jgi:peptide-methionine (S)-S-oxide reductase
VGYAGGTTSNPTYRHIGDHTETFQVDFDPIIISYDDLLALFWQSHNPATRAWSRQYRAIALYQNDSQREAAERSRQALMAGGQAIRTAIVPLTEFYLAETYHQKHSLQNTPLMAEIKAIYPDEQDWLNSTAAARLNGYLSGYGRADTFEQDIKLLGLSAEGERLLRRRVSGRTVPLSCALPAGK